MICNSRRPVRVHDTAANNATLRSMKQSAWFDDFDAIIEQETMKALSSEQSRTAKMEHIGAELLGHIIDDAFAAKYGVDFSAPPAIHSYMFTQQPRACAYCFEAFAAVVSLPRNSLKRKKEEMVFHTMFEDVIQRYTKTRAKPNPVLLETRSSEFCYRLTIVIEAVPIKVLDNMSFQMSSLRLFREYEILYYIWEKYREEFIAMTCPPDQLVGIPMPFEFVNVKGNELFDFEFLKTAIHSFDIHGTYVLAKTTRVPSTGKPLESFLSYMSMEKLGPSLSYLADLMKSQKRWFSVSTALKILDQILCRLIVLHRYGVILGNMDLRFLNFGVREAFNVLYVNNFDCAVVAPNKNKPLLCFNERFASMGVLRGTTHFVNDIETAFYIFLALLVPRLPWDEKQSMDVQRNGSWSFVDSKRNMRMHLEERQRLWDNPLCLDRLLHSCNLNSEASSPSFEGFIYDVVQMVHAKTKEAINSCSSVPQQDFMTNTMTVSTVANNAFTNIRKVIVSFFRFESLSNSLRDATCQNKVKHLLEVETRDNRSMWDLNDWCWNIFETSFLRDGPRKSEHKSMRTL